MTRFRTALSRGAVALIAAFTGMATLVALSTPALGTVASGGQPNGGVAARCSGYLPTGAVAGMASTPNGGGYWITDNAGLVVSCGNAPSLGSISFPLTQPIVGMAATPSGDGYWLVAADGGIFSFGNARYYGSDRVPIDGPPAMRLLAVVG
jgi:hypothetical protein